LIPEDTHIARLPEIMRIIAEGGGLDTALRIAKEFGGGHIYIPKLDDFIREIRDDRIRREVEAGATVSAVARRYLITERQVYRILTGEASAQETLPLS